MGLAQNCDALRQEGDVYRVRLLRMQPSVRRVTDISLLTEGTSAPVKSINMALLTEGELALSWIDSERQNNNTNASATFNHTLGQHPSIHQLDRRERR